MLILVFIRSNTFGRSRPNDGGQYATERAEASKQRHFGIAPGNRRGGVDRTCLAPRPPRAHGYARGRTGTVPGGLAFPRRLDRHDGGDDDPGRRGDGDRIS